VVVGEDSRRAQRRRCGSVALGVALLLPLALPSAGKAVPAPGIGELAASLSPAEVTLGEAQSVTGRVGGAGNGLGGVPLTLQANRYPFRRGFAPIAHTTTAADGSYSFPGIRLDRNTRLQVILEGSPAATGPVLAATVDPKVSGSARSVGPGRVRLILRVRHTPTARPSAPSVWWFLAMRPGRVFRLAAVTRARETSPGSTSASVIVDPPAKRFVYRVCLNARWDTAMGRPEAHRRCPEATFVLGRHAS
jgi:hypothetical protein